MMISNTHTLLSRTLCKLLAIIHFLHTSDPCTKLVIIPICKLSLFNIVGDM
ncbi:hypothetical protein HanIR_Chr13g0641221 [Helianthus annuus]|nr:hypothetical protein HanIR_Chr13g0641221 [Helianthus annuus]